MKILVGIPAYNEGKTISMVINSTPKNIKGAGKTDILVVDDGSTDNTADIAQRSNAVVLSHILNRGLGAALKTIFYYAKENHYDLLVTLDADGQHEAKDIKNLIMPIIKKDKDVVIGSRWLKKEKAPKSRYYVNLSANIITSILFGVWSSDSQSGFRAFGKKAINCINLTTDGMEVSSEILKEVYENKLKLSEIPIKAIYTDYSLQKGQRISNGPKVLFNLLLKFLR